ncbi:hypothetical protein RI129_004352 [Pyrocoelia pectoralis]|uniref:Uncharacterized protein n=1 Tax=Pyrocoelia pectoralis TaxID=417401 RepID=A0AAN7VIP0_9COLE
MALSGLSRNECEPLGYLFDEGAKVINTASSTTSSSSSSSLRTSPSITSSESGIASISNEYFTPPSDDGFSLLRLDASQLNKFLESLDDHQEKKLEVAPLAVNRASVMWTGRNVLDLYDNIRGNGTMYTQAVIPKGVNNFFNNRSLLSRLNGATVPPHNVQSCSNGNCEFIEYVFT